MEKKPRYDHGEYRETPKGYIADLLDNPDDIASATDFTGLIPTPPLDDAQAESYNNLYAVPQQPRKTMPPLPGATEEGKQ